MYEFDDLDVYCDSDWVPSHFNKSYQQARMANNFDDFLEKSLKDKKSYISNREFYREIVEHIERIAKGKHEELIISIPYLFFEPLVGYRRYTRLLKLLFKLSAFKTIYILTDGTYSEESMVDKILAINSRVQVRYSDELLENVVIVNREESFFLPLLPNGLGRRYFSVQPVSEEHTKRMVPPILRKIIHAVKHKSKEYKSARSVFLYW